MEFSMFIDISCFLQESSKKKRKAVLQKNRAKMLYTTGRYKIDMQKKSHNLHICTGTILETDSSDSERDVSLCQSQCTAQEIALDLFHHSSEQWLENKNVQTSKKRQYFEDIMAQQQVCNSRDDEFPLETYSSAIEFGDLEQNRSAKILDVTGKQTLLQ